MHLTSDLCLCLFQWNFLTVVFASTAKELIPSSMSDFHPAPNTRTWPRRLWTWVFPARMSFCWCSFGSQSGSAITARVSGTLLIGPFVCRLLQEFANATLRTLCLCYKDISATEFEAWSRKHREAQLVTFNREDALDRVYEEIEKNLMASGGLWFNCSCVSMNPLEPRKT